MILSDTGIIQKDHLGLSNTQVSDQGTIVTLQEAERSHILRALEKTNGVVGGPNGAAALLGMNRTTLLFRMKKLDITRG